jgi:uncharacterized membrane protein
MSDWSQLWQHRSTLWSRQGLVAAASLLIVLLFLLAPTSFPLGKLDAVGYAVCHRIPARTFFMGNRPLPLCARCSGTFLGVFLTLTFLTLMGRSHAGELPPLRVLSVLVGFIAIWAVDGLNSYLTFYPSLPHLYEPQNWLRLTTGMLNGLAVGTLVFYLLQFSLWRRPRREPVLHGLRELVYLLIPAAVFVGLVLGESPALLYPLAIASTLGVVMMFTSVNTVIILVIARRENTALRHWDAVSPLLAALASSLLLIMGIGAARALLTEALNLPF